jgi:hypothetical protein
VVVPGQDPGSRREPVQNWLVSTSRKSQPLGIVDGPTRLSRRHGTPKSNGDKALVLCHSQELGLGKISRNALASGFPATNRVLTHSG